MKLSDHTSYELGNIKEVPDHVEAYIVGGVAQLEKGLAAARIELGMAVTERAVVVMKYEQLETENETLREGILDAHNTLENIPHDYPKNWGWVDDELTYVYTMLDALLAK